jgi:hypothetical protein
MKSAPAPAHQIAELETQLRKAKDTLRNLEIELQIRKAKFAERMRKAGFRPRKQKA